MKVLEAQSAVLSNWEVYNALVEQQSANSARKRRGPPNYETVVREVLQHLRTHPGPLSQQPSQYGPECIKKLMERLRPYSLFKGEVVMILNLRPSSVAALNTVVEDMGERYNEEQQEEIVAAITEVLGQFEATGGDGGEMQEE